MYIATEAALKENFWVTNIRKTAVKMKVGHSILNTDDKNYYYYYTHLTTTFPGQHE